MFTMLQEDKTFEVDQIVCVRKHKGCQEYLVYWKGFDLSVSTWEPVENLLSCADLIEQFQRKVSPIPGANPFSLKHTAKPKTVNVKMLLTRKNKVKKPRSKSLGGNSMTETNGDSVSNEKSKVPMTPDPKMKPKKRFNKTEKPLHDTLSHEGLATSNGIHNDNCNGSVSPHKRKSLNRCLNGEHLLPEKLVLCTMERSYMKITLNNTNAHNLVTISMLEALQDGFLKAKKNEDVKAVLLTGNGSYFCSGLDYSSLIECSDDNEYKLLVVQLVKSIKSFLEVLISFTKPIVCALNGPALEFGTALVVNSDFAYGNAKASFDVVYSKIRLTPIGGLTYLLPRFVGNGMANSMFYLCERVTALVACDRGLLLDMYGVNSFDEDMEKKMSQLTANAGPILESMKRLIRHHDKSSLETTCEEEFREYKQALLTNEVRQKLKDDWAVVISLYGNI